MKVNYFQKGADVSQSVISKATAVEVKAQTIEGRRLHHGPSGSSLKLFHTLDLSGPKLSHLCWLPTHRTLKSDVNQVPYEIVQDLETAIGGFMEFYNHRRYHKALGDVTPAHVLEGRREAILARRKEVRRETFQRRRQYNQQIRDALKRRSSSLGTFGPKVSN